MGQICPMSLEGCSLSEPACFLEATKDHQEKPMELWLVLIILTVLIISGVWGSIILSGLFKRRSLKNPPDDPRFEALREEDHQLEARIERLEEEIGFLRELQKPEAPRQLTSSEERGP